MAWTAASSNFLQRASRNLSTDGISKHGEHVANETLFCNYVTVVQNSVNACYHLQHPPCYHSLPSYPYCENKLLSLRL